MAVFDKSGYSHSETSLVAVIYKSSKVRPPYLCPRQTHPSSRFTLPGPHEVGASPAPGPL